MSFLFSFKERKDKLKDRLNSEKVFDYKLAEERKANTLSCIECDVLCCCSQYNIIIFTGNDI